MNSEPSGVGVGDGGALVAAVADGLEPRGSGGLRVVLTGLSSDSHTWNLVYLHLLLEELGCDVTNLGACTPDEAIVAECAERRPDLLVVSSLNGHGVQDGTRMAAALRRHPALAGVPAVIGGKLDVSGGDGANSALLLAAGFDAVFDEAAGLASFRDFVGALQARTLQARALQGRAGARELAAVPAGDGGGADDRDGLGGGSEAGGRPERYGAR